MEFYGHLPKKKKELMLFDSLGLDGFKIFIVNNYERIIEELLFNFKKCKISLTDQKITLCEMKFSVSTWENMPHTKKEQLTKMAENFFHLLQQPVQDLTSSNCGIFQLYFYKNLFDPDEKSKVFNHEI